MNCQRCNSEIKDNWEFCPGCGARIVRQRKDIFSGIFERMNKELRQMDRLFEKNVEALDISPWFSKTRGTGFSIKIVSGTGIEPKVEVHSFGGVNEDNLMKQVASQLGLKERPVGKQTESMSAFTAPKTTEEPKTNINRTDGKVVVELDIPGLSEDKTEIRELSDSIEVKAMVGDKAYFKILTKPPSTRLASREFRKGKLVLELY